MLKPTVDVIWDLETYPNIATFCFIRADNGKTKNIEISSRNKKGGEQLVNFINKLVKCEVNKYRLVGFNNLGFDYPVLHYIVDKVVIGKYDSLGYSITPNSIYTKAMAIINATDETRFMHLIPESKTIIPQLDLYKIHHFDNAAKSTSLKMLEFNMRSNIIEDLPFPVGKYLTPKEGDMLKEYNTHDVLETLKFYKHTVGMINFRESLTKKYGINFLNANDTKIGKDYFIYQLELQNKGCCYDTTGGKRKMRQTPRDQIHIKDVIFPYVKFDRPEFNAVLEWFKKQTITETKGVFTDILEKDLGDVAKYAALTVKKIKLKSKPTDEEIAVLQKENPFCWVEEIELKAKIPKKDGGGFKKAYWHCWNVADCLNVVVDGFRFDFGTGGIHGSIESTIVKAIDGKKIKDWDVASMYPNIAISNGVYPEHLGVKFCDIYKDVYDQRKSFAKKTPENEMLKLALNGVYGDSNNKYSVFYDPQYTMAITINGQLSLCMLAERLLKEDGVTIIQVNTDGVTALVSEASDIATDVVAKQWENDVKLELELNEYSQMIIRDVNNYIAVYTNGKVKRKGAYEYADLGWHKNHGGLVIQKAAEQALVYGGDIEKYIRNHDDMYDFMLRTKVPRSSRLVIEKDGIDIPQQNICRYYVSEKGGSLVKIMPPIEGKEDAGDRRIGIETGWNVKTCNNIKSFEWDIDYNYYVSEAEKLVLPLLTNTESVVE